MTKAEILSLIKTLTQSQADDVTISGYFDQLLDDLGRRTSDLMTAMEVIPLIRGTDEYNLPDLAVCEHAIFLDDRELRYTTVQQLEARDKNWRDHLGKPWASTKDEQTARQFRVYPTPNFSSSATDWSEGEPLGRGFPSDALTIFYSSRDSSNIPSWLVLPIVWQIISWEFSRPSKHQSQAFSDLCAQLAAGMFQMIGVDMTPVKKEPSR